MTGKELEYLLTLNIRSNFINLCLVQRLEARLDTFLSHADDWPPGMPCISDEHVDKFKEEMKVFLERYPYETD